MIVPSKIDPQLLSQIAQCGEENRVYALLVLETDMPDGLLSEADAANLIADAHRRADGEVRLLHHFPRAGAILVAGSPRALAVLITDDRVLVASATTIGLFATDYGHY